MLRDPVEHAVSSTRFDDIDAKKNIACLRARSCTNALHERRDHYIGPEFHVYDNFMIRRMLGETGMQIKPGGVTQEHANKVIEMLEKFEVVAILDNFGDTLSA